MNLKKLLLLVLTIVIVIATLFLINKKVDIWYFALLVSPITLFYNNKMDEFISHLQSLFSKENWKRSQKRLEKTDKLQADTLVRISFAYLFRIKVEGMYFLVLNKRTHKYQPVGGAYKFNKEEAIYLSKNFSAENDDFIAVDDVTKMDYRLLIKNKYLREFMKRFDKTSDRENIDDLSREFVEEVFGADVVRREDFKSLTYSYCGRHITDITPSAVGHFEILLADIVEVHLSDVQESILKKLSLDYYDKYKLATVAEIKRLGMDIARQDYKDSIANHTPKILSENEDQLFKKLKYKYKRKYKGKITIFL